MASTERAVRDVIVNAIKAVAVSKLGFSDTDGNIRDYLLEEEIIENASSYLAARVGGQDRIQAWAVQVYGYETLEQSFTQAAMREYDVVIEGYYGAHGETPINTLIDHAREVRKVVRDLGGRLSETVQAIIGFSKPDFSILERADAPVKIYKVRMVLAAEKRNADW